jgi:subtilisin
MARRTLWLVLLLAVFGTLAATTASAEVPNRKIVVFRDTVSDTAKQGAVREVGGNSLKQLGLVNATAAELTPTGAAALALRPDVVRVEDDSLLREDSVNPPTTVAPDRGSGGGPGTRPQSQVVPWGVDRINAARAWEASHGGDGVKVAVLDSGIDLSHPDLKVVGGVNEVDPGKSYNDDRGHGTHVAGIIAALNNSRGVVGVAPSAALYAVKVLDKDGSAWASDIIAGLDWCVSHKMRVVNMSFGTSEDQQSIHDAIIRARAAGIVLVASAGNYGPAGNSVHYPALYPEVLAVSATDSSDKIASWSSNGPQIAVAAPGVDIYSTYFDGGYATMSGTSMAAPHVTGAIALRLKDHPRDTPDDISSALRKSADKLRGLTRDQQGAGLVDAFSLVKAR